MKYLAALLTLIPFALVAAKDQGVAFDLVLQEESSLNWGEPEPIRQASNGIPVRSWTLPAELPQDQYENPAYAPVKEYAVAQAVYCDSFESVPPATDHYWPFDGNANDVQGGEDGTIIGGAGFVAGVPGRFGDQAIDLDGSTQRVDIPLTVGTSLSALAAISFSAFVNFDTIGDTGSNDVVFMIRRAAGGPHQLLVRATTDGSFGVSSRPAAADTQVSVFTGPGLITLGQWHHIATIVNVTARTIRLYVDGRFISEFDVAASWGEGSSFDGATSHAVFGADPSSATIHWLDGRINDARLYHRALNDAEIADLNKWAFVCRS